MYIAPFAIESSIKKCRETIEKNLHLSEFLCFISPEFPMRKKLKQALFEILLLFFTDVIRSNFPKRFCIWTYIYMICYI